MRFVKKFTPPDFQAKNFTPLISPNFNSFGDDKKMSENGEIYTAGKNFTLPDFQAKNFTPLISPNFNSFGDSNTKKGVNMEKFAPLAKILHCCRQ